jgi:two-component system LytT family sensor kinase
MRVSTDNWANRQFAQAPAAGPGSTTPAFDALLDYRAHGLVLASGRQISHTTLFSLLHWGGWLAFGAVPFAWTVSSWSLWGAFLNNALFITSGGLVTLGLRTVYRHLRRSKVSYAVLAAAVLLACAILAEVWYLGELLVGRWCFQRLAAIPSVHAQFEFGARALAKAPLTISMGEWFVFVFALLTWSSLYFGINSAIDLKLERARVAHALALADAARLKVLQSQLNPHFLFNALNGVATLIREHKGWAAAKMVSTLSDFLRATLRTVNLPEITVSEELVFIDQYIEIQQLRFADRLHVDIDAEEETYWALVPTLIMQPLVENAVQHGVLSHERPGSVSVSIARRDRHLRMSVEDDGPGPAESGPPSFGLGLANTKERLHALYGEDATMLIGRSARGGFSVVLHLPFRESAGRSATTTRAVSS